MRVVALISGGKDSCYNMMQCIASGHQIVALANLRPYNDKELNSYMFQSAGHEAIELISQSMDVPLFRRATVGIAQSCSLEYTPAEDDEIEDLFQLLKHVKESMQIEAVSSGAVLSDYQRIRVENVCIRLGLVSLAYLWQRKQAELLQEMMKCEMDPILIRIATAGLDPHKHLGRSLRVIEPQLQAIHGINICGEGGEYETLTLDCPLFKSRLVIEDSEIVIDSANEIVSTGYMKLKKISLVMKLPALELSARLANVSLMSADDYVQIVDDEQVPSADPATQIRNVDIADITQAEQVSVSGGGWLFLGSLTAVSEEDNSIAAFEKVIEKLKSLLKANRHRLQDLCSVSMYVADMSQYAELNRIYCDTMKDCKPPTRACVQVPLAANCPVIIDAISWKQPKYSREDPPLERTTLHVQSVSHWCPANIGPYSQAIRIGEMIHLAGQIGLVPGSMEMIRGGIKTQAQLVLRHIERLLKAVAKSGLRDVVQGICYLTDERNIDAAKVLWEEQTNNAIVDYIVVSQLPRNALIEWHVWAHKHNHQFEYEETGQCVQDWSISIFRRWNEDYENNTGAIVCHISNSDSKTVLSASIFRESVEYVLKKLNQAHKYASGSLCNLKVFYPIEKNVCVYSFVSILEEFRRKYPLVHTIIPVKGLLNNNVFLSICGVRIQ